MEMIRKSRQQLTRRVGKAVAAGTIAAGLMAVSALPAAASFTTPKYGMTCNTGSSGSTGSYHGWAQCYTPDFAKWKIRLNCSWGGTYDSYWVVTGENQWYTLTSPQTCYWGVNSVSVIEGN